MSVWDELQDREKAQTEAIRDILGARIDEIVAARDFGAPSAAKRGRNPKYPYVPIIKLRSDGSQLGSYGSARTRQLKGLAYAERDEAVICARIQIEEYRRRFAADLCRPNARALREYYGLPREPLAGA